MSVPDGVHATVDRPQATRQHAVLDRAVVETQRDELPPRHHSVLRIGEQRLLGV